MNAHTPGPWTVDVAQDSEGTIHSVDVREAVYGLFIAAIEAHTEEEHPDVMANARLIAAAPELLELCKRALAAWEGTGPALVLDDLRSAIAKAEGK